MCVNTVLCDTEEDVYTAMLRPAVLVGVGGCKQAGSGCHFVSQCQQRVTRELPPRHTPVCARHGFTKHIDSQDTLRHDNKS